MERHYLKHTPQGLRATCGADVPPQQLTSRPDAVTCEDCAAIAWAPSGGEMYDEGLPPYGMGPDNW